MTNATTNYGILLKRATVLIGEVISSDAPEYINETVEATYHKASPNNWREFVSSELLEFSEFKATINYTDAGLTTLAGDLAAGTLSAYTMTFPNTDVWTFSALVTKIKPLSSDATSPETLQCEVTFRPSGSSSIA